MVHPLYDALPGILVHARACGHSDLFCDYDGVLTPVAARPEDAFLDPGTRDLLAHIARHPAFHLSVVSGRALDDVRDRVDIPEITYVGNHGLEIEGPDVRVIRPIPQCATAILRELAAEFPRALSRFPGVIIEDKHLGVAVHFRLADPGHAAGIRAAAAACVAARNAESLLRMTSGKDMVEARIDLPFNKGTAVMHLLELWHGSGGGKTFPVYIGDDETDEDAFRALAGSAITVRVEDIPFPATAAEYGVAAVDDVRAFLDCLFHTFDHP